MAEKREQSSATAQAPAVGGAEVCEAERQGVRERKNERGQGSYTEKELTTSEMIETVELEVRNSTHLRHIECGLRSGDFFREGIGGVTPGCPNYRDALLAWADIEGTGNVRGALDFAYGRFRGCIARYMATQIKGAAAPPTQPDSGRMRADESNSVNGRIRAGKPLFTCCDAQTTNAHINDFNHDWDIREETLYQLGANMCEWGVDSKMQTIAGRAAFLQACDEKIAAARARARSK